MRSNPFSVSVPSVISASSSRYSTLLVASKTAEIVTVSMLYVPVPGRPPVLLISLSVLEPSPAEAEPAGSVMVSPAAASRIVNCRGPYQASVAFTPFPVVA